MASKAFPAFGSIKTRAEWIAFHSFINYRTVIEHGDNGPIWSHNGEKADTEVIGKLISEGLIEKIAPSKYAPSAVIYGLASIYKPKKRP